MRCLPSSRRCKPIRGHAAIQRCAQQRVFVRVDEMAGEIRSYAILMPVVDEVEVLNIGVALAQQRKAWAG